MRRNMQPEFSKFTPGTENTKPSRTESYYLKDLFKQGVGNGGMNEKDGGRANAITLLMAERILPGPWGALKGICKFNPK